MLALMSAPPPIIFATVALIAWPLVQLVSVLIARPYRLEMQTAVAGLRADPSMTAADLAAVDALLRDARGSSRRTLTVLRLPGTLLASRIAALLRAVTTPDEPFRTARAPEHPKLSAPSADRASKLSQLGALADRVMVIRSPFSAFLGAVLAVPILAVYACLLAAKAVRAWRRRPD